MWSFTGSDKAAETLQIEDAQRLVSETEMVKQDKVFGRRNL
jgi:hypothetical protein